MSTSAKVRERPLSELIPLIVATMRVTKEDFEQGFEAVPWLEGGGRMYGTACAHMELADELETAWEHSLPAPPQGEPSHA